jgi:tetratricopeptide (TPR) repeat protein
LDQLGERTWLLTDGMLDTHLTLLAAERGRPLHLLNLSMDQEGSEVRRLRRAVADDPKLQPYRARLLNAASLGVATFLREWLAVDPGAPQALALYGVPDFWVEAGLTVCPDRFLFLAVRSAADLQNRPSLEELRAFWKRMEVWLPLIDREKDPADSLRRILRRHLSLVANDVGVLLMDLKRMEEAYGAFEEALALEPESLSAKLNLQVLVEQGLHPNDKEVVEAAAKKALAALKRQPTIFEVVRAFGQIRSAQALAGVGEAWVRLGQYGLAQGSFERAIALASDDGARTDLLASLGAVRLTTRDIARSEAIFEALVKSQPGNPSALLGMLNLALLQGNAAAARDWLGKARVAGADPTTLVLTEARIDIAERKFDDCCALLLEFTDRVPQSMDGWTLMAAAMIEQGRLDEVERQVLPKMEKIARQPGNPLILQVRGAVARAKGPAFYAVAREAYRGALGLLPGRRNLLEAVFDLDLVMGDEAGAEKDARDLLRVDRDHPRAHFVLGTQAVARGDLDAGEWHLRSSLLSGPTGATWNNLADLMRQKGSLDEAEDAARQALARAAKNAPFLETLAAILLEKGKLEEAARTVDQARTLAPEDWQVAFTAARILMKSGQPEEARILLRQVLAHVESLPQAAQADVARVAKEWKSKR